MDTVSKTLYIPLYGRSYVSRRGLFLKDEKAEAIWEQEAFLLKGKSASKWLAFYMGIRAAVFDAWVREKMEEKKDAVILHLGCGMDSRAFRLHGGKALWYDVDLPEVIEERKRYYSESDTYRMLAGDMRKDDWLSRIPKGKRAVVVMEGLSMYLRLEELKALMEGLSGHFDELSLLMDCYSLFAAKASKYKNPVRDVGVSRVHGLDDPTLLQKDRFVFVKEHSMTPEIYIHELQGLEKHIFKKLYAGSFSKKLYRLYEFKKD